MVYDLCRERCGSRQPPTNLFLNCRLFGLQHWNRHATQSIVSTLPARRLTRPARRTGKSH
jgi:hypothetical protein